jgi:hypothetical protein
MFWPAVVMSVVAVSAVIAIIRRKRPVDADELGAVSDHWIAQHRVESP